MSVHEAYTNTPGRRIDPCMPESLNTNMHLIDIDGLSYFRTVVVTRGHLRFTFLGSLLTSHDTNMTFLFFALVAEAHSFTVLPTGQ